MANVKVELLEEEIDGPLIDNDEDNAINDPLALDCDNGKLKKGKQELDQPCNYKENLETAPFELHLIIENIKKEEDKEDSRNADEETNDKPLILGTEFEDAKIEGKVAKEKTYQSIECDDVGQTAMDPLQLLDLQLQEVDEEPKDLHVQSVVNNYCKLSPPGAEPVKNEVRLECRCSECGQVLASSRNLKQHLMIHTNERPFQCSDCFKSFRGAYKLKLHMRTHNQQRKRPFKCSECVKSFSEACGLRMHMKWHSSEKRFKCNECDKAFPFKSYLEKHVLSHSGERPFKCSECDKCFHLADILKKHMQIHSDRSVKCLDCGKTYSNSLSLKCHSVKHKDIDDQFVCSVCNKSFITPSNLTRHMLIHTGEKPYKCLKCDKTFSQSYSRKIHMLTHSENGKGFKCSECDESFTRRDSLKNHMLLHTGERPFKCSICVKSYACSGTLKKHFRDSHSGKTFKCFDCNKVYSTAYSFKKHSESHGR